MAITEKLPDKIISINRADLPELPTDWHWVPFSSVCERVSVGHVGPTAEYFRDRSDGITFLRSQNVRPGRLVLETATAISPEFHRKLKKSKLQAGDILFVRVGANRGDCCVVPQGVGELNCANIVFARPKHPTGFHAYFFQSEFGQNLLHSASVGAAQGVINTGSIASMPVPLPPLATQRKIAGILSAYDDLIENNLRRIKILEEMVQSLYREWFVHLRFPGHESERFVDSDLGRVPKGWEVTTLGELVELRKGKNITQKTIREGNVPVVAGGLTPAYFHDTANTKAPVVTISASGANAGFVNIYFNDVWASDCSVIDFKVTNDVFYFFLLLKERQNEVTGLQRGSAQPHVYPKDLMTLGVLNVPAEQLESFAERVSPIFQLVRNLSLRNQTLRSTRDLLLPKLLSTDK